MDSAYSTDLGDRRAGNGARSLREGEVGIQKLFVEMRAACQRNGGWESGRHVPLNVAVSQAMKFKPKTVARIGFC